MHHDEAVPQGLRSASLNPVATHDADARRAGGGPTPWRRAKLSGHAAPQRAAAGARPEQHGSKNGPAGVRAHAPAVKPVPPPGPARPSAFAVNVMK